MNAHEPKQANAVRRCSGSPATDSAELSDDVLRAEIELLSDVIAEVGHRQGPLDASEIDRILGVTQEESP